MSRIDREGLHQFFSMLSKTDIIRFDDDFRIPRKPSEPKSLNFWIHTTDACNLSCSYCYIPTLNKGRGMAENVQKQLIAKLVETVSRRGINHVKFRLAGGEPLTQFKTWKQFIPKAKETLAEFGCVLDFSFLTNLTILDDDIIEFSKHYGISYGVSLDGVGEFHDHTRKFRSGTGSFDKVDSNLRWLLSEQIPVSVTTVISNQNLAGLPELTRYLIELNVPFRYSIVKGEQIDAELLQKYLLESYSIMRQAIETGWEFSKRHQFCHLKPNELGFQTCASGFSGGAIYTDGTFKYCHVHFGNESPSAYSIFDRGLDLVDMIEKGEHHEDVKSEDCKQCRYRYVCTSGCPVYRVGSKDPQCSIYHQFIPLIYELQGRERLKLLKDCRII